MYQSIIVVCLIAMGLTAGAAMQDDAITLGKRYELSSERLGETRSIMVSTPRDYETSDASYPVVVLLDGDSHFHHTTAAIDFLARNERIPPMIVLALPNTDRTRDLTPPSQVVEEQKQYTTHGGAPNFQRFIADELMPWAKATFRTNDFSVLIGHSFGGLFAINVLASEPALFDAYIAISPSLWWDDQRLVATLEERLTDGAELSRALYMTVGNEGGGLLGGVRKLAGVLGEQPRTGSRWAFRLMEEETHGSVPYRSTYQGLEMIFAGWALHDPVHLYDVGGIAAIHGHFAKVSAELELERDTPASTFGNLLYELTRAQRLDDALKVVGSVDTPNFVMVNLAEALSKSGRDDDAIGVYARILDRNPVHPLARERLVALGEDVSRWPNELTLATDILERYVGRFDMPGYRIEFTIDDGALFAAPDGAPKARLQAVAENVFNHPDLDAKVTFQPADQATVDEITVTMNGTDETGRRVTE